MGEPVISPLDARRLPLATAILRVTLGVFLLLWGIEKLVIPATTVSIWERFYLMQIGLSLPALIGIAEILFALWFLLGFRRRLVYGIAVVLHGISTVSTWKELIDPWGLIGGRVNHLFLAGVPVLAAFVALYLLREYDLWTVDGRIENARLGGAP